MKTSSLKNNLKKYELVKRHMELVHNGQYEVARYIYKLLNHRTVRCGTCDSAWEAEKIIENAGFKPHYNRTYTTATFYF